VAAIIMKLKNSRKPLFASQISVIFILTPCYQARSTINTLKTGLGAGFAQKGYL
jgi:hypothetical protein